jgi:hypothetical protein
LAPSVSQLEGHDDASGWLTIVKLESSPLGGTMVEVDPLMVASGPKDELPLEALPLPPMSLPDARPNP